MIWEKRKSLKIHYLCLIGSVLVWKFWVFYTKFRPDLAKVSCRARPRAKTTILGLIRLNWEFHHQRYKIYFNFYIQMSEWVKIWKRDIFTSVFQLHRYRRGLETCPQAKSSKSGHAIFFFFFRRFPATSMTQRRVENSRVHFWTFSPVSVKLLF